MLNFSHQIHAKPKFYAALLSVFQVEHLKNKIPRWPKGEPLIVVLSRLNSHYVASSALGEFNHNTYLGSLAIFTCVRNFWQRVFLELFGFSSGEIINLLTKISFSLSQVILVSETVFSHKTTVVDRVLNSNHLQRNL